MPRAARSSSTIMVMMIAMTPSRKGFDPAGFGRWLRLVHAGNDGPSRRKTVQSGSESGLRAWSNAAINGNASGGQYYSLLHYDEEGMHGGPATKLGFGYGEADQSDRRQEPAMTIAHGRAGGDPSSRRPTEDIPGFAWGRNPPLLQKPRRDGRGNLDPASRGYSSRSSFPRTPPIRAIPKTLADREALGPARQMAR